LKEQLDSRCDERLEQLTSELGISSVTGEDDLYVFPRREDLRRLRVELTRTLVTGDLVRGGDDGITAVMKVAPVAAWLAARRPDLRVAVQGPDDPQPLGIGFGKNQAALLVL
jgi:hypothetical protein